MTVSDTVEEIAPEVQAARDAHLAKVNADRGDTVATAPDLDDVQFLDTYSYTGTFEVYLPNQEHITDPRYRQYIVCTKMTEGLRQKYQKATNAKVTIKDKTRDAELGVDPARDRYQLLKLCVTDWFLLRRNQHDRKKIETVPFSVREFEAWFEGADPEIIEAIESEIRSHNPWMTQEMTVDAIDAEIERLQKLREEAVQRELIKSNIS